MSITDRELLKLAAKAAGIEHPGGQHSIHNDRRLWDCKALRWWNPLTDDGDALRLAVKMGMRVYIYPGHGDGVTVAACDVVGKVLGKGAREGHNSDPYAATRRAIVRAAAEIGRAMP
jgi:hypothetical protein